MRPPSARSATIRVESRDTSIAAIDDPLQGTATCSDTLPSGANHTSWSGASAGTDQTTPSPSIVGHDEARRAGRGARRPRRRARSTRPPPIAPPPTSAPSPSAAPVGGERHDLVGQVRDRVDALPRGREVAERLAVEDDRSRIDARVLHGRVRERRRVGVDAVQREVDRADVAHADEARVELLLHALHRRRGRRTPRPASDTLATPPRHRHGGGFELHALGERRHDPGRQPLGGPREQRLHDARLRRVAPGVPAHVGHEVAVRRIEEVQRVVAEDLREAHLVDEDARRRARDAPLPLDLLEPVVERDRACATRAPRTARCREGTRRAWRRPGSSCRRTTSTLAVGEHVDRGARVRPATRRRRSA